MNAPTVCACVVMAGTDSVCVMTDDEILDDITF